MERPEIDILECLNYISPADLDYSEWVSVGMALKEGGYSAADWDNWSRADSRYHTGECFKKWTTFHGTSNPVTVGTIVQMAKANGWRPAFYSAGESYELDWDASLGGKRDGVIIKDTGWLEGKEIVEPHDSKWSPVSDLVRYIDTLFESTENVGYVTESWFDDTKKKYLPTKGNWDRTAGELIQALNQCKGDIGAVIGDYKEEVGAWIRFNPLDGNGVKNENVTDFRYALVESDSMELEQQNALIRELELPVACLVHSGKKSIHAIVRIDAPNYDEYRKRVDFLYGILKKNGMQVDTQNKNPSRLSRMPGIVRNGKKQFLIDTNIGKSNWQEWKEWIDSISDDLPDPETLTDIWGNLPELSPPLIEGVLRQGHKMLIAGPSKAGKSYALIELCCAIAEGKQWLQWKCTKGKVLYVNLELDRASCLHRFKDIYDALGWRPDNIGNIDIWNLRGKSAPMDILAPKLIRRALKKNYIAIVIDPIYKVITGDENSADQMAKFCNQFDLVCTELGAAVIYCHHHSKGAQGGKKSMDRASGSGVFARDPDALIDVIQLDVTDAVYEQEQNNAVAQLCQRYLERYVTDWDDAFSQDDACSQKRMLDICQTKLSSRIYSELQRDAEALKQTVKNRTAWRIEGTLREFPKFSPVNMWFDYPCHKIDKTGTLEDLASDESFTSKGSPWKKNFGKKKSAADSKKEREASVETAYGACSINGPVTVAAMAEFMGVTEKTARNRIKEHGDFWIDGGSVGQK